MIEWIVLSYKNKIIGITTLSDTDDALEEHFENFDGCDIFVCAARNFGQTCDLIRDVAQGGKIVWLAKEHLIKESHSQSVPICESTDFINRSQTEQMLTLLENELLATPSLFPTRR